MPTCCTNIFITSLLLTLVYTGAVHAQTVDCSATVYGAVHAVSPQLHVDGRFFKDQAGRVVLLRGVNATGDAKVPPFQTLTRPELLDPLPLLGINVLRLLFIWEAFETDRCHYQEAYLQYYEQVVRWAEARGLYVIVDFHQDAFSRYAVDGCGEGFPKWAVLSDSAFSAPDNSSACETWGYKMAIYPSHHNSWSDFHQDKEGVRSRYVEMVKKVADRMARHRNVIGYDLINEPWGSEGELLSLFTSVSLAIRSRHPRAILFMPAHTLIGAGFIANRMERPDFRNIAYAPHFYDAGVMGLKRWFGNSPARWLDQIKTKSEDWQVPMLLGEFGAPASTIKADEYLEAIYQWLDAEFVSGAQWNYTPGWTEEKKDGWNAEDFSIVDGSGQLRRMLFEPRVYPQKTAGVPLSFKRSDGGFKYSWNNDPKLGETQIFIPAHYQDHKKLHRTGPASTGATCQFRLHQLSCRSARAGLINIALEHTPGSIEE